MPRKIKQKVQSAKQEELPQAPAETKPEYPNGWPTSAQVKKLRMSDRKWWAYAKKIEVLRMMKAGNSDYDAIAASISSSRSYVFKLLARQYKLPAPDVETQRGIESRKFDKVENRAEQMYLTNLRVEEREVNGQKVKVQVVPPGVLATYAKVIDQVMGRRHRLFGLEMPIKHVVETDIAKKLEALERSLPQQYYEVALNVFAGGSGSPEEAGGTPPQEGEGQTH